MLCFRKSKEKKEIRSCREENISFKVVDRFRLSQTGSANKENDIIESTKASTNKR